VVPASWPVHATRSTTIDYDHASYHPVNVEPTTAAGDCAHGARGCDICTRACPRFGAWELDGDQALHGRGRRPDEVFGIAQGIYLAQATHPEVLAAGQDGGLVSALLIWGLESGRIEGALTSRRSRVLCPDFAASLADLSVGGLGQHAGWTLTIVRTGRGADWLRGAAGAGAIAVRPGQEDPAALALLGRLAARSRTRSQLVSAVTSA